MDKYYNNDELLSLIPQIKPQSLQDFMNRTRSQYFIEGTHLLNLVPINRFGEREKFHCSATLG